MTEELELDKESEAAEEAKGTGIGKIGNLFTPEGIMMLLWAIVLDGLSIVCVVFILLFGVGVILAKIIYIIGLISIGTWALFRSGAVPIGKKGREQALRGLTRFLKRYWKRLAAKAIPAIGDALPLWTWTVYSELTS